MLSFNVVGFIFAFDIYTVCVVHNFGDRANFSVLKNSYLISNVVRVLDTCHALDAYVGLTIAFQLFYSIISFP